MLLGAQPAAVRTPAAAAVTSRLSVEELRKQNMPLVSLGQMSFKPFVNEPEKQARYEEYLECKKQGVKCTQVLQLFYFEKVISRP